MGVFVFLIFFFVLFFFFFLHNFKKIVFVDWCHFPEKGLIKKCEAFLFSNVPMTVPEGFGYAESNFGICRTNVFVVCEL